MILPGDFLIERSDHQPGDGTEYQGHHEKRRDLLDKLQCQPFNCILLGDFKIVFQRQQAAYDAGHEQMVNKEAFALQKSQHRSINFSDQLMGFRNFSHIEITQRQVLRVIQIDKVATNQRRRCVQNRTRSPRLIE